MGRPVRSSDTTPTVEAFRSGEGTPLVLNTADACLYCLKDGVVTHIASPNAGHQYHDDIQGTLQTALTGVTTYTFRQLRNTGMVFPHIATNDIFSMTFQFPHRKTLETVCDSVHLHIIPVAAATGDVRINYSWGWWNPTGGGAIPDTLPTSSFTEFSIATADQYKLSLKSIIANLSPPASEAYSSLLLVKCQRVAPAGTDYAGEFALAYMDAHYATDHYGSYTETGD